MPGEFESAGRGFAGAGAGFGCVSPAVDRFASSSVAGGVETGVVGALLTIGLRPAQPPIAKIDNSKNNEKKGRSRGQLFPYRTLKRNLSPNRHRAPLCASRAILRLPPVSRTLPAGTPQSSFPFPAQRLPRQTALLRQVSRLFAFQTLQICSWVTPPLLKRSTRFEYYRNAQRAPQGTKRRTDWHFPIAGRCVSTNLRIHCEAFSAAEASSPAQNFALPVAPSSAFPPLAATNAARACAFLSPPSQRSSRFFRG